MTDELGWFNTQDTISVGSNQKEVIAIPGTVFEDANSNELILTTCAILENDSECKTINISSFSCPENSNLQYNDLSECYEIINGDINIDGIVNVQDIMLLVNNIIGDEPFTESFDINSDNIINIQDILAVVNIIIS